MLLKQVTKAKLPTKWGNFLVIGFEELKTGNNHLALVYGNINKKQPITLRIHSECLTGDALFSLRCDCGFQLTYALQYISKQRCGVLIYHRQEGRNIGLLNKICAYSLQDQGYDTVEANYKLGFLADERNYSICSDILKILGIKEVYLLTNNPHKIKNLERSGILVSKRIPIIVGKNLNNINYLKTKFNKLGHLF